MCGCSSGNFILCLAVCKLLYEQFSLFSSLLRSAALGQKLKSEKQLSTRIAERMEGENSMLRWSCCCCCAINNREQRAGKFHSFCGCCCILRVSPTDLHYSSISDDEKFWVLLSYLLSFLCVSELMLHHGSVALPLQRESCDGICAGVDATWAHLRKNWEYIIMMMIVMLLWNFFLLLSLPAAGQPAEAHTANMQQQQHRSGKFSDAQELVLEHWWKTLTILKSPI